jgi:hypothetical protein
MQTFKGANSMELVFNQNDVGKLQRGYVVHTYSAAHYKHGTEIVAAKLEPPSTREYERLGYTLVETVTSQHMRGHRTRIDRRTPAMVTACLLLEQANALLAQTSIPSKGKRK